MEVIKSRLSNSAPSLYWETRLRILGSLQNDGLDLSSLQDIANIAETTVRPIRSRAWIGKTARNTHHSAHLWIFVPRQGYLGPSDEDELKVTQNLWFKKGRG